MARLVDRRPDPYTVAAFDLVGHGDPPVPDDPAEHSRDRALDDLDDVLERLSDGLPEDSAGAVLVGHSLGGYLALAHAATRPGVARGLVVLSTGPGFRDPDKREGWNERHGATPTGSALCPRRQS